MPRARQEGFLLLTVVVILAVLAAVALMLSASVSSDNALVAVHGEDASLDYLAESGMQHAQWLLAQTSTCDAYSDLPATPFGAGSYSASVSPTSGSPVSVTAVGALSDGTTRRQTRDDLRVHNLSAPVTIVFQPGAEGQDAFIEGVISQRAINNGDDSELRLREQAGLENRALLQFDLSILPPTARIATATLELELLNFQSSHDVNAHRLLRAWTESGVTWQQNDDTNTWNSAGGDYAVDIAGTFIANSAGPVSMDITALAAAWANRTVPNHGLILLETLNQSGSVHRYASSDHVSAQPPKLTVSYYCECGKVCTGIANGNTLVLSTDGPATLGGLSFSQFDLVNYDPSANSATLVLDGSLTTLSQNINAVHLLSDGRIVLSTREDATLGGLSFEDADLVAYDPLTDTATMYFDGSLHFADANEDISAVHILSNGNIILSTDSQATLGGVTFSERDLVEYNPSTSTTSIFFDGDATTLSAAVTAVHVLEDGDIVLAAAAATVLGGLSFTPDDVVRYNPATDTASLYLSGGSAFADPGERISSVYVDGDSGPTGSGAGQYFDQFNTIAYNGDDGTLSWSNDWQETGEANGATLGDVRVVASSTYCRSGNCLQLGGNGGDDGRNITGRGLSRAMDLTDASAAVLSFDAGRQGSGGSVEVQVSNNAGSSWNTLATIAINTGTPSSPTAYSYDITAFASADSQIRFYFVGSLPEEASAALYIDNVNVSLDGGGGGGGLADPYTETYQEWRATAAAGWQVQNLAAFGVPGNAVVEVAVMNARGDIERSGGVRAVGSALERRLLLHEAESGGVDAVVMHVQANGNAEIEHYAENTTDVFFAILGYWSGSAYVERFDTFSASSSGSWQDHNLNVYGVGAGQVAELVVANKQSESKRKAGVRANGSGVGDRFVEIHEAESGGIDAVTMLATADNTPNATIEVYAEVNSDIDFYLMGFWSTPPGTFTEANGSEFDPSSPSGVWSDWSLSGAGVPAGAVAYIVLTNGEQTQEYSLGVRGKGSTADRWIDFQESENGGQDAATWHALVDETSTIEFYDENAQTNHRFRVLGWWVLF